MCGLRRRIGAMLVLVEGSDGYTYLFSLYLGLVIVTWVSREFIFSDIWFSTRKLLVLYYNEFSEGKVNAVICAG